MSESEHLAETKRWLRYAQEDLMAAEAMLTGVGFESRHVCWLAQQSSEKALKAALVWLQIDFPWRHDLDALRILLPDDWQVKHEQLDLATLTEWAMEARYPGDWPEANEADAQRTVEQARAIWRSIIENFSP